MARPRCRSAAARPTSRCSITSDASGGALRNLLTPPPLPRLGQQVDRVVVLVPARHRLGVVLLDPGPVVLRPVRNALLPIVLRELVHPPLAHVGHVADDARRREPGEIRS